MKFSLDPKSTQRLIEAAAAGLALVLHQIDLHLWHPAEGYVLVLLLLWADFGAAAYLAYRQGRFETRRARSVVHRTVGYTLVLFFAHNLGKYETILAWLPQVVFLPLVLLLLLSFIKNLSLLGWIPEPLAEWLHRRIDTYKNRDPAPPPEPEASEDQRNRSSYRSST